MSKSARKRDPKGKFLPGCPAGPGRPPAAKEEAYLTLLRQTVDLAQWQKAVLAVLRLAQDGNLRAFEALARHILPLPAQRLKISEAPVEEYRVAGLTPGQLNAAMLERLATKIEERRIYEEQLAKAGVEGYGTANGNAVSPKKPSTASKTARKPRRAVTRPR